MVTKPTEDNKSEDVKPSEDNTEWIAYTDNEGKQQRIPVAEYVERERKGEL